MIAPNISINKTAIKAHASVAWGETWCKANIGNECQNVWNAALVVCSSITQWALNAVHTELLVITLVFDQNVENGRRCIKMWTNGHWFSTQQICICIQVMSSVNVATVARVRHFRLPCFCLISHGMFYLRRILFYEWFWVKKNAILINARLLIIHCYNHFSISTQLQPKSVQYMYFIILYK